MTEDTQTKSGTGSRSGARKGAGRKAGAATQKTRERADRAVKQGKTPLEVMLEVMLGLMEEAEALDYSDDPEERAKRVKLQMLAADVAKGVAPYVHPRLSSLDHTTNGKDMAQTCGVLIAPAVQSEAEWESKGA